MSDTTSRGYPLPNPANTLDVDVVNLRNMAKAIDADMGARPTQEQINAALAQINGALATKASTSDMNTLLGGKASAADLAALSTEVGKKQATLTSGSNIKTLNGLSLLGSGDIVLATKPPQLHSNATTNGTDLPMSAQVSLYAPEVYSRYLPASPVIGDWVELYNAWGHFSSGNFTLRRRNANHGINYLNEDVVFNFNVGMVRLHYTWDNLWTLSAG